MKLLSTILTLSLLALLLSPASQAAELQVIKRGHFEAATAIANRWEKGDGCIYSTGSHYLFANKGLGSGDFKIRARLSLDAFNGSAAAFVLNNNKFGFEGSHRRMFVQGPQFPDGLTIGEPADFITPGKPFDLLVTRREDRLSFKIDGKPVWSTGYDVDSLHRLATLARNHADP